MSDTRPSLEEIQKVGIPFGSRALGVNKENADWDFAMTSETYRELFKDHEELKASSIGDYFLVYPDGDNFLLQMSASGGEEVDILIFEHKSSLLTILKALKDMIEIPKYMLRDKTTRVNLYQRALAQHGFNDPHNLYTEKEYTGFFKSGLGHSEIPEIDIDEDDMPF